MPETRVLVVGAGVAGLVAALRLAHQGLQVTVLERGPQVGGKLYAEMIDGVAVDTGPTVFTMRWVFDELLHCVGTSLDSELSLQRLPVLARHFWHDGSALDLFDDARASEAAIETFAGAEEAARFRAFCARTRALYDALEGPFIRSQLAADQIGQGGQFTGAMHLGMAGQNLLHQRCPRPQHADYKHRKRAWRPGVREVPQAVGGKGCGDVL